MKTKTAVIDAITAKRQEQQKILPTVKWGDKEVENQWRSKYLGSMFEAGGGQMHDVQVRIARSLEHDSALVRCGTYGATETCM